MAKVPTLKKPTLTTALTTADVQAFAEGAAGGKAAAENGRGAGRTETAPAGRRAGLVPEGDVRLTANIRGDLHLKLKIRAAQERTTVGELIEQWIEGWR